MVRFARSGCRCEDDGLHGTCLLTLRLRTPTLDVHVPPHLMSTSPQDKTHGSIECASYACRRHSQRVGRGGWGGVERHDPTSNRGGACRRDPTSYNKIQRQGACAGYDIVPLRTVGDVYRRIKQSCVCASQHGDASHRSPTTTCAHTHISPGVISNVKARPRIAAYRRHHPPSSPHLPNCSPMASL